MGENDTLSARQRRAIGAILSTSTLAGAATEAHVSRKTLYRWLALPTFQAALQAAQGDALGVVMARLSGLLGKALDVIGAGLDDTNATRQLRAAALILGHYAGLAEFIDLASRVAALEAQGVNRGGSENSGQEIGASGTEGDGCA